MRRESTKMTNKLSFRGIVLVFQLHQSIFAAQRSVKLDRLITWCTFFITCWFETFLWNLANLIYFFFKQCSFTISNIYICDTFLAVHYELQGPYKKTGLDFFRKILICKKWFVKLNPDWLVSLRSLCRSLRTTSGCVTFSHPQSGLSLIKFPSFVIYNLRKVIWKYTLWLHKIVA